MLENLAHVVMDFLSAHPHWGSILTFVVAFTESLAVIGTIVPGSVTMTAIGVMAGTGALPIAMTFFWATLGALFGDYISYWVGKNYSVQIRASRFFQGRGHWLEKGEAFFHKHGGKSVIVGRFFGPVRSLVPLIAGLLQMSVLRFTLAVIPAAFLWAVVYMLPGIALGALSLELPPSIATKFLLYGLLIILGAWAITRVSKLFLDQIWQRWDQCVTHLWARLSKNERTHWIRTLLADPKHPDNHQQLMLVFICLMSAILFVCTTLQILHHGIMTCFNEPVYHFLNSIRTHWLDVIMLSISILADKKIMLPFALTLFIYFMWQKKPRTAWHWIALIVLGAGTAYAIKHGFYNPRPRAALDSVIASSYPSGHTILATLIFGFMAVLVGHELPSERKPIPYRVACIAVLLVMLSRLYLGAHWLTDTLGSLMLGMSTLCLVTLSYRRQLIPPFNLKALLPFAGASLLLLASIYGLFRFDKLMAEYANPIDISTLSSSDWWEQTDNHIPLYRNNRLGKPFEMLTIQWAGNLNTIEQQLQQIGWQSVPPNLSARNVLKRAAIEHDAFRLTLIPQQFQARNPVLLMVRIKDHQQPPWVLRLWNSDITLTHPHQPLYVGSIRPMSSHKKNHFRKQVDVKTLHDLLPKQHVNIKTVPLNGSMNGAIPPHIHVLPEQFRLQSATSEQP